MNLKPEIAMQGFYRLTVRRRDGSVKQDTGWFPNLILDEGLNGIGKHQVFNTCYVGSGSTPPIATNTKLENLVGSTSGTQSQANGYLDVTPYYGWSRRVYRFLEGAATGNLSEVGVGYSTATYLFSRALILDGNGAPTTITVLADEVLDVAYELRLYPPLTDNNFNLTIAGVNYACKMRAAGVSSDAWSPYGLLLYGTDSPYLGSVYDGDIGTMFQYPSGNSGGYTDYQTLPYANNSLKRGYRNNYDLNTANFGTGIKAIQLYTQSGNTLGSWQCSFTPPIPKTNTKKLSLTFEVSWARKV